MALLNDGRRKTMKQLSAVVILVLAMLVVLTAGALASAPKKGATYVGDIKAYPFTMHVDIKVNPSGTKLSHFTYLCGTGRAPTTVFGVPIDKTGHFKWARMTGSVVVWKMAGRFVSPTKAFISINSLACGGSKGSTTLSPK
jgi:hypothetical protein